MSTPSGDERAGDRSSPSSAGDSFSKTVVDSGNNRGLLEGGLLEAANMARAILEPKSLCILRRIPLVDEECPEVSDVDLVSVWQRPEELPERFTVETRSTGRVFVDVLWIPVLHMLDSSEAASYKMLTHLLTESEVIWMRTPELMNPLIENIKLNSYEKQVWEKRLRHQVRFGDAAVQEARKNIDFPPAAIFFLQTAHAYYLTALADYLKESTMSLMSRPMPKLRAMAKMVDAPELEPLMSSSLHLVASTHPSTSVEALERIYNSVSTRCSNRKLQGVRGRTRGHYAYTLSPLELEYRRSVANAMIMRGDLMNASFYLRFWAYSLSRCPVVLDDAGKGRNPSFYIPDRRFKEAVEATCPEILAEVETIMVGAELTRDETEESIQGTLTFRQIITDNVKEGMHLENLDESKPAHDGLLGST